MAILKFVSMKNNYDIPEVAVRVFGVECLKLMYNDFIKSWSGVVEDKFGNPKSVFFPFVGDKKRTLLECETMLNDEFNVFVSHETIPNFYLLTREFYNHLLRGVTHETTTM